ENLANESQWHREPDLLVEHGALIHDVEIMVVLEPLETAAFHGVLKKGGPLILRNDAFMHLRQSELPPSPQQLVVLHDQSAGLALDGLHPQCPPHQLNI